MCSNAANYFHALRRQIRRPFRKPLVSFNSKRLLRYARATSELKEFGLGTRFRDIIPEAHLEEVNEPAQIKKVVLCSGQVYYDILERRETEKIRDTVIIRLEQLSPFPYEHLKETLKQYTNAKFIWV